MFFSPRILESLRNIRVQRGWATHSVFPSLRNVFASGLCSSQLVTSVWTSRTGAACAACAQRSRAAVAWQPKTPGDWGCLATRRRDRVKRRGGEVEVKGLHSAEAKQRLFFFFLSMLLLRHPDQSLLISFCSYRNPGSKDRGCQMVKKRKKTTLEANLWFVILGRINKNWGSVFFWCWDIEAKSDFFFLGDVLTSKQYPIQEKLYWC